MSVPYRCFEIEGSSGEVIVSLREVTAGTDLDMLEIPVCVCVAA